MYSPENGTCIYVDVALPVERACNDGGWGLRLGSRERTVTVPESHQKSKSELRRNTNEEGGWGVLGAVN